MVHRLAICFFVFMGPWACSAEREILRLGAAASLSDVLPPLLESAQEALGVPIEAVYGGSGELAAQVRHGADLDALFLASDSPLLELQERGLVEITDQPRVGNRLVLAGVGTSAGELSQVAGVSRVGIGTAGVPAGDHARIWLEEAGLEPVNLVEFGHVRAVLACIESGSCDLGFVYATDLPSGGAVAALARWEGTPRYGFAIRTGGSEEALALALQLAQESPAFEAAGFLMEAP